MPMRTSALWGGRFSCHDSVKAVKREMAANPARATERLARVMERKKQIQWQAMTAPMPRHFRTFLRVVVMSVLLVTRRKMNMQTAARRVRQKTRVGASMLANFPKTPVRARRKTRRWSWKRGGKLKFEI